MKAGFLAILISASFGISGEVSAAPMAAPVTSGSAIQTVQYLPGSGFPFPHAEGAIVDWCAVWADGCGWPGAHQFCQARGFSHALGWDIFRPGRTFVIGSHRYCEGGGCKGFRFVRCG